MSYLFFEDFSFHDEMRGAYNIAIERNSDLEHGHATVADDAYHILVCGNKHFAKTPAITNFDLKLDLNIKTSQFEVEDSYRTYGFRIFFRYDRFRGKGYLLEGGATVKKITVKLIAIDNSHQREILQELEAPTPDDFNPTAFKVGVEARKNIFNLKLDDLFLSFTDDNCLFSEGGSIGLDKTYYPGELIVEKFLIESDGDFERSRIIPPLTVELPCIQGMSVPYKYTLNLSKFENGPYELAVKLEGGIKDRPDRGKPAGQWVHEIDRMRDPYIRVESPCGEIANILLFNGLKTLLDREEERPWVVDQYPQPQWPLERTIYFDKLPNPEELFFAVGYEYFFNDPKRFLAGGPFEALCDSVGETLWVGKSLRRGDVVVSVKSPKGKRLVSMIPHDVPDYEKAVIHAENNNYFVDDEKITFKIDILYRSKLNFSGEFNLNVELRSVFGEKLANEVKVVAIEENSAAPVLKDKLGMESSSFDVLLEGTLDTGVYHLNVVCERGGERIHDEDVVFEVMSTAPDAVSPPLASGLPLLFSIPNETKYLHTDAFDPLYPATGAAHYFGMSSFASIYGREKRIWELLSLYKRKWFVAIDRRTAFDDSIEGNQDVLKHCDYTGVPLENKPRHGRYELWKEDIYTGDILNTLIEFFTGNPDFLDEFDELSMEKLEELRKENGTLPQKAFVELVDICWSEWLEFFSAYYAGVLSRHFEKLKSINKDIRTTTGGPFSLYAAHNKSAYFLKLFGHDVRGKTRNFYNGFWQFEDYAHSCGYSFTKAPFAMMTIKLHYENWNIFPEIYSTMLLDGCNDGAVSQAHPPFGFYQMPVALMRERIYEYAFATTWFKEGEFRYWKDNGFHLRNPKKEYVAELLRAWGNTRKHRPVKPVRTSCFLADVDLIAMHPDHYEANCNVHAPWKDVVNTAEEAMVYTYEAARSAGIPAGFATRLDELDSIDPKMTDLIVLPPLMEGVELKYIDRIRELHQQGVNLLGFERVCGLEDLFGVVSLDKSVDIQKVAVVDEYAAILGHPGDEFAEHELAKSYYANVAGTAILAGAESADAVSDIPLLTINRTKWGRTAFFNIPPTVVKRDSFVERVGYGQECVSVIMKAAAGHIVKELSDPVVEINGSNAKIISFYDEHGDLIIVVEQEELMVPDLTKYPQSFLLTINIPGLGTEAISCDEEFSIASEQADKIVLRVGLGKYESALFKVEFPIIK